MPLFLGIDGGGTKTTCAVGDETSTRAVATASGSNVVRLGEAEARIGLQAAISQACCNARVSPLRIQSACVGVAGAAHSDVNATVRRIVQQILPNAEISVVGDMVIAHEAALHSRPGVITIAGTGSIAYGRNAQGETARAGGWGFAISDEGSGHWIGRSAVSQLMRALDANCSSTLLDGVLQVWGLTSQDDLVRHANGTPTPNFSELFPAVQQAASEGDAVAFDVLERAGKELGELTLTVLRRLWAVNERVAVGVAGGVFANSMQVRRAYLASVRGGWRTAGVCFQISDPVNGALSLARRAVVAAGAR